MLAVHVDWTCSGRAGEEQRRLALSRPLSSTFDEGAEVRLGIVSSRYTQPLPLRRHAATVGGISVVADARLDNLDALAAQLELASGTSLPEVLSGAYLRWGDAFPDKLTGDFAFALWDGRNRRLVVGRDPFGVRPLVYRVTGQGVWVASSVEQILGTFQAPPTFDDHMVVEYLLWRHQSAEATFFRDVRRVLPGHTQVFTPYGMTSQRYWLPSLKPALPAQTSQSEFLEEFRRVFRTAVTRTTRSAAPVALHVSGGLDSSCIAVTASALLGEGQLPAPSLLGVAGIYPGLSCDERPFIEAVAREVSFPVQLWDATQTDNSDLTNPSMECPGGRIAQVGGTKGDVALARRAGARIIISGAGGDQLTTPEGIVQDMLAHHQWFDAMKELLAFPGATPRSRLARLKYVAVQSAPAGLRSRVLSDGAPGPHWLNPDLRTVVTGTGVAPVSRLQFQSYVQRQAWERLAGEQLGRSVDRLRIQLNGLEMEFRFPYLDRDLVKLVLGTPHRYWPAPRPYARLHRAAFSGLLPASIANRFGKAEFTDALISRARRAEALMKTILHEGAWSSGAFVERGAAQRFWVEVTEAQHVRPWVSWWRLWGICTLEAWMRAVLGYYAAKVEASI